MRQSNLPARVKIAAYIEELFKNVVHDREDMHGYQNIAVQFVLEHPFCALFIDLGLGKSIISLTSIVHLVSHFDVNYVLVVAPVRVANETWPTEIRAWRHTAPLSFTHVRSDRLVETVNKAGQIARRKLRDELVEELMWEGFSQDDIKQEVKNRLASDSAKRVISKVRTAAARKAVREQFIDTPAVVHIINREQLEFLVDAWGRSWPYDCVVIDESSSLKDHKTGRFKALRKVRPLIKRMLQLTATPAAETYLHLFPQIYLLDEGKRFGRSITNFRKEYFDHNPYSHEYTLKVGAEERIAAKIADITLTMRAEDYLDMQKPLMLYDRVFLDGSQRAIYDEMQREFVVTLPSGATVEAETAAALVQKLLQLASGVLYETVLDKKPDGSFKPRRVVHHVHDRKIEALQTIVEEAHGENILVAYWHEASLSRLRTAFPQAVVMDKNGACVKAWNSKKIPMLLVHPQSAGHGLNLQHGGRRIVFFDIPWSLELYLQLIGRLARQGQMLVVIVHHLLASGTVDEDVVVGLTEKRASQDVLFDLLRKLRKRMLLKVADSCEIL